MSRSCSLCMLLCLTDDLSQLPYVTPAPPAVWQGCASGQAQVPHNLQTTHKRAAIQLHWAAASNTTANSPTSFLIFSPTPNLAGKAGEGKTKHLAEFIWYVAEGSTIRYEMDGGAKGKWKVGLKRGLGKSQVAQACTRTWIKGRQQLRTAMSFCRQQEPMKQGMHS